MTRPGHPADLTPLLRRSAAAEHRMQADARRRSAAEVHESGGPGRSLSHSPGRSGQGGRRRAATRFGNGLEDAGSVLLVGDGRRAPGTG
jgi:hypothetical protein